MMRGAVTTDLSTVVERMRDKRTLFKEEKPLLSTKNRQVLFEMIEI